jgi:hypothetical protein
MNHLEFEEKAELGRMVGLKFHTTSREGDSIAASAVRRVELD